jgi:dihydroneopterin aldolase
MRFHTTVGVLPHEREYAQPLEADLTVWLSPSSREGEVVDYRDLYELVAGVVGNGGVRFLEDAAARVAELAMAVPRVTGARVALRKPHVALPGPLAHAEVVLERGRRG